MDFKVKCDISSTGCPGTGELRHLKEHYDEQCKLKAY